MKTDKLVLISNIDRYIGAGIVKGMMLAGVVTGRTQKRIASPRNFCRHLPGRGGKSNDAKIICKSLKLLGILLPGVVTGMMFLGIFNLFQSSIIQSYGL